MLFIFAASGEESSDEEGDDENELEKQMGDLGEFQSDKLDEQMWGSDEEEDQEVSGASSPTPLLNNSPLQREVKCSF